MTNRRWRRRRRNVTRKTRTRRAKEKIFRSLWASIKSRVCFSAVNRLIQHSHLCGECAPASGRARAFASLRSCFYFGRVFICSYSSLDSVVCLHFAQRSTVQKKKKHECLDPISSAKIQNTQTLRFFDFSFHLCFVGLCFFFFYSLLIALYGHKSALRWAFQFQTLALACVLIANFLISNSEKKRKIWMEKRDSHGLVQIWYENHLYSMRYCLVGFVAEIVYLCQAAPYRQVSQQQHAHTHTHKWAGIVGAIRTTDSTCCKSMCGFHHLRN